MEVKLPLEMASLSLVDLRRMLGCDERNVRRKLRKRDIKPDGKRILLEELRAKWPLVFNSILILADPKPRCPKCDAPTQRACTCCDFVVPS